MRRHALLLPAAIVLLGFALRPEPPLTIETVLARWERASHECRSLDVELTRMRYKSIYGSERPEEVRTGRFYCEAPNRGRLEFQRDYIVVWKNGCIIHIQPAIHQRQLLTPAEIAVLEAAQQQAMHSDRTATGFWQKLRLAILFAVPLRPTDAIPFILLDDRTALEREFDVTLGQNPNGPLLTMKPRAGWREARCDQIEVILDPTTYRTFGIRQTQGRDQVVYVVDKSRINECPADRNRLLELTSKASDSMEHRLRELCVLLFNSN